MAAPNAEYAAETREELLYNKEKLLTNGEFILHAMETWTHWC
jgi:hypothetical protein